AYGHQVLMDFAVVYGRDFAQLNAHLNGRGVPSLDLARREIALGPVLQPLGQIVNADNLRKLTTLSPDSLTVEEFESLLQQNLDLAASARMGTRGTGSLHDCGQGEESLADLEKQL